MALPPTIPTSFVPYSASASARRFRGDYAGAFGFFGYAVLFFVFALAIGVFLYGRVLAATRSAKDAELAKAEAAVDPAVVDGFVRLHNRLSSGQTLLANHIALSGFFNLIEAIIPATVSFTSLHLSFDTSGKMNVEGSGVAKSFNALAVTSTVFAADGRIKNAIFSNIVVRKDNSVSFAFVATLDPKLTAFSPSASVSAASTTTGTSSP
ncbi:hypothetical protein KGQ25_00610 [Patescibacteria group bacterium]|nr:hypothetical protein [Patescibacteria group bacterium]MDE2021315.1 hypothetical protein [Patescibacteria group bacterium]MDE2173025.1 hypothetical protein [Patescibacteria group bacterium]